VDTYVWSDLSNQPQTRSDLETVEQHFIQIMRPCLNGSGNNHPSALPKRYIQDAGLGAQRAARAAFGESRSGALRESR